MEKTIFKYELVPLMSGHCVLEMPIGAAVLTVQMQRGKPHLWALVDKSEPREKRVFMIRGTGGPCHCSAENYIGTFQIEEDNLVFHVFEDK